VPVRAAHDLADDAGVARFREAETLSIVVPMAGAGSRFAREGFVRPKPLIDVLGRPMIHWATLNLRPSRRNPGPGDPGPAPRRLPRPWRFVFVVRKAHREDPRYDLEKVLRAAAEEAGNPLSLPARIVEVDGLTDGAASTVLRASQLIDNDGPLLIANSDQWIDWGHGRGVDAFLDCLADGAADGCISTFESDSPAHSYAELSRGPGKGEPLVRRVAEKEVISSHATTGLYLYARGRDFVASARSMIAQNIRHKGEFYVCPVYNELLKDPGAKVRVWGVGRFHCIGTPKDLRAFLAAPPRNLPRPEDEGERAREGSERGRRVGGDARRGREL
jgi:NDP-sugar pyrophosphorylase family protein